MSIIPDTEPFPKYLLQITPLTDMHTYVYVTCVYEYLRVIYLGHSDSINFTYDVTLSLQAH